LAQTYSKPSSPCPSSRSTSWHHALHPEDRGRKVLQNTVSYCSTAWHHNPEDLNFNPHHVKASSLAKEMVFDMWESGEYGMTSVDTSFIVATIVIMQADSFGYQSLSFSPNTWLQTLLQKLLIYFTFFVNPSYKKSVIQCLLGFPTMKRTSEARNF
jgi:hypothetical protein